MTRTPISSTRWWALSILPWLLSGCGAQNAAHPGAPGAAAGQQPSRQEPTGPQPGTPHDAFTAVLRDTVHGELIDYLAVRDRHWPELTGYLDQLAAVDPQALSRGERLAHHINLYNATMIRAVCERLRAGYSTAADDWKVFEEKLVHLHGDRVSLNQLENEIIRKRFEEPRIHVALVCGARSCPPILPRAYLAADLEVVLETNMRRFVRDESRNRIGPDRVAVSQIFSWYEDDFGGDTGLPRYLSRYAGVELAGREIEFMEYSWELNLAAPESRAVRVVRPASLRDTAGNEVGPVEKGALLTVLGQQADQLEVERPFGAGRARLPASAAVAWPE